MIKINIKIKYDKYLEMEGVLVFIFLYIIIDLVLPP
jgi:hypothetical protein